MRVFKYLLMVLVMSGVVIVALANETETGKRVELIVKIAQIKSAADAYFSTSAVFGTGDQTDIKKQEWIKTLQTSVTEKTLTDYQAIDAKLQEIKPTEISPMLERLREPQTIALVVNQDRSINEERRIALNDALMISDRLEQVVAEINPTRKEYFLATSALQKLAGNFAREAISGSGEVLNMQALVLARAHSYSAREIRPRWVSFCDAQKQPVDTITEKIYFLDDNSIANQIGEKVSVTSDDYFALASEAEMIAAKLPQKDEEICP